MVTEQIKNASSWKWTLCEVRRRVMIPDSAHPMFCKVAFISFTQIKDAGGLGRWRTLALKPVCLPSPAFALRARLSWSLWICCGNLLERASLVAQWWRICQQCRRPGFAPWVRKIPRKRAWQPTPVFLPGESHGQRGLAGCSPQGRTGSDVTEATKPQW